MDEMELSSLAEIEERHWWFAERRNLLRVWATQFPRNTNLLDIGAGVGTQSRLLKNEFGFDVIAVELSTYGSNKCRNSGLQTLQESAINLSSKDGTVDAVIAMDVLEHIQEDRAALLEINRVLKSNGKFFITVPAFKFMWSKHDEAVQHVRRYSKREITQKLRESGFLVTNIRYWNSILFPLAVARRVFNLGNSDLALPPKFLNILFGRVVAIERKICILNKFPGTSIIIAAKKI
jgi:ubiquinone/menaquinone biosynthesis C-methylase UbiE